MTADGGQAMAAGTRFLNDFGIDLAAVGRQMAHFSADLARTGACGARIWREQSVPPHVALTSAASNGFRRVRPSRSAIQAACGLAERFGVKLTRSSAV